MKTFALRTGMGLIILLSGLLLGSNPAQAAQVCWAASNGAQVCQDDGSGGQAPGVGGGDAPPVVAPKPPVVVAPPAPAHQPAPAPAPAPIVVVPPAPAPVYVAPAPLAQQPEYQATQYQAPVALSVTVPVPATPAINQPSYEAPVTVSDGAASGQVDVDAVTEAVVAAERPAVTPVHVDPVKDPAPPVKKLKDEPLITAADAAVGPELSEEHIAVAATDPAPYIWGGIVVVLAALGVFLLICVPASSSLGWWRDSNPPNRAD